MGRKSKTKIIKIGLKKANFQASDELKWLKKSI